MARYIVKFYQISCVNDPEIVEAHSYDFSDDVCLFRAQNGATVACFNMAHVRSITRVPHDAGTPAK